MHTLTDHGNTVDNHILDAGGILMRCLVSGAVGHGQRIKDDQISPVSLPYQTAILPT